MKEINNNDLCQIQGGSFVGVFANWLGELWGRNVAGSANGLDDMFGGKSSSDLVQWAEESADPLD